MIGEALSVAAGPIYGPLVGIIADSVINYTDEVMKENELAERKRRLREMMVAPTVSNVGQVDANGQLAGLLLDSVGYTAWLQVASLDDLWKFRIPPEFPDVDPSLIRFKIAAAVIGYLAAQGQIVSTRDGYEYHRANDIGWWVKQLADKNVDPINVPRNVIEVSLKFGRESNPYPSISSKGLIQASYNRTTAGIGTRQALYEAIQNRRIGDLKGVPVLVDY